MITLKKIAIITILLISSNHLYAQTYIPPLGIPAPEFGINEKVTDFYTRPSPEYYTNPSPLDEEIEGWYYIDQHHDNASNSNTYGTPANPRISIPDPVPPGSVVEVNGVYNFAPAGFDLITANGTLAEPVFIIGSETTVVMRKWLLKSSYTIVENIEFTDRGKITISYPSHHVSIRNNNVHNIANGTKILGGGPSDSERISHIVIYNNQIHSQDGWDKNPDIDQDGHGINLGNYIEDIWILDNTAYNNAGNFVQVGSSNTPADNEKVRRYYIGRNTAYANRQSPIGIKQSSDVIISENRLYNNRIIQDNARAQSGIIFQYGPERLWIINNRIYNSDAGISAGGNSGGIGQEQYIIGNLIYDIHISDDFVYDPNNAWDPAAIVLAGGTNRHIVNNTIYDVDAGVNSPSGVGLLNITGNIISSVSEANHIFLASSTSVNISSVYNNIFFQDAKIRWANSTVVNLATFENANPLTSGGNLEADPLFRSVVNDNYQLQNTPIPSPAINSGIEDDVYQVFEDLYGLDIRRDINGSTRPIDSTWDIGAFEFTNGLIFTDNFE